MRTFTIRRREYLAPFGPDNAWVPTGDTYIRCSCGWFKLCPTGDVDSHTAAHLATHENEAAGRCDCGHSLELHDSDGSCLGEWRDDHDTDQLCQCTREWQ